MAVMSPTERKITQGLYFFSQFCSIGSAFSGSMLGIHDYMYPTRRKTIASGNYIWIFGLGLVAATIGSFTAHKFQGQKIGAKDEDHEATPPFNATLAPQNWKSKLGESSYYAFAAALSLANNYLLVAGLNAFLQNSSQSILPPGYIGVLIFALKTFLLDLPFDGTSAIFEAGEEIKEAFTNSKAGTLLGQWLQPIAKRPFLHAPFIFWIQTAGTANHTATDVIGFVVSLISLLSMKWSQLGTAEGLDETPSLCYPLAVTSAMLFVVNCIQTLYFEAAESTHNMKMISDSDKPYEATPLLFTPPKEKTIVRTLLTKTPWLKTPLKWGFYTQAPLNAFGDLMPAVLLLQDIFDRHDASNTALCYTMISIIATLVFIGSCKGTFDSEVATSIWRYKREFSDINSNDTHNSNGFRMV